MEASKVTLSAKYFETTHLSGKAKRKLKETRVKELIRSKEAGHLFSMGELIAEAGYDINNEGRYTSGHAFITRMVKSKIITRDEQVGKKYSYSITSDTRVVKPAESPIKPRESLVTFSPQPAKSFTTSSGEPKIEIPKISNSTIILTTSETVEIIRKAKEFAWQRNSDSLREFIASLQ